MLKIFAFYKSENGCDWYRLKQPLSHISAHKEAEIRYFKKGEDFAWFAADESAKKLNADLEWADIIFVPRINDPKILMALQEFQKLGKKIVTEWDDNIFAVSPLTLQYQNFGQEEYTHVLDCEKMKVWIDGKNIDLAKNRLALDVAKEALRTSDMVITTTDELAKVFAEYNPNVKVCPNSIDTKLWKKLPLVPHQGIRMGWFGGDTHYQDWKMLSPILPKFMALNPEVTLVILGKKFEGSLAGIDPQQIEHHEWTDIHAYPLKAATLDLDFAVIPLGDNPFNNGKSPIKWLEMASLQVPSVTSFVKPYDKMMDLVKENGIFIESNDLDNWLVAMTKLAKEPETRTAMGKAARETVEQFYDAGKTYKFWLNAFEDCAKQPSKLAGVA